MSIKQLNIFWMYYDYDHYDGYNTSTKPVIIFYGFMRDNNFSTPFQKKKWGGGEI